MTAPAATSAAADAFARTVSSLAATELGRMRHALSETDLADPDATEWFVVSQRETLAARAVLLAVRDLVRPWEVPAAVAIAVLPDLRRIAADAVADIPPAMVAAVAAGEDPREAYIAAVEPVYAAVVGPAGAAFAAAGLRGTMSV